MILWLRELLHSESIKQLPTLDAEDVASMHIIKEQEFVLRAVMENLQRWTKKNGEQKPEVVKEAGDIMGNVAISITVTPESPDVDFDSLKKEIEEKFEIKDMKEELIGFGLKKLKLMIIRPDKEGQGTDDLEEELSSIEGVASVNIDDVTLVWDISYIFFINVFSKI